MRWQATPAGALLALLLLAGLLSLALGQLTVDLNQDLNQDQSQSQGQNGASNSTTQIETPPADKAPIRATRSLINYGNQAGRRGGLETSARSARAQRAHRKGASSARALGRSKSRRLHRLSKVRGNEPAAFKARSLSSLPARFKRDAEMETPSVEDLQTLLEELEEKPARLAKRDQSSDCACGQSGQSGQSGPEPSGAQEEPRPSGTEHAPQQLSGSASQSHGQEDHPAASEGPSGAISPLAQHADDANQPRDQQAGSPASQLVSVPIGGQPEAAQTSDQSAGRPDSQQNEEPSGQAAEPASSGAGGAPSSSQSAELPTSSPPAHSSGSPASASDQPTSNSSPSEPEHNEPTAGADSAGKNVDSKVDVNPHVHSGEPSNVEAFTQEHKGPDGHLGGELDENPRKAALMGGKGPSEGPQAEGSDPRSKSSLVSSLLESASKLKNKQNEELHENVDVQVKVEKVKEVKEEEEEVPAPAPAPEPKHKAPPAKGKEEKEEAPAPETKHKAHSAKNVDVQVKVDKVKEAKEAKEEKEGAPAPAPETKHKAPPAKGKKKAKQPKKKKPLYPSYAEIPEPSEHGALYRSPKLSALPEGCRLHIYELENQLGYLLDLVERVSQTLLLDKSIPYETRLNLSRQLFKMRSAARETRLAANLANLRIVSAAGKVVGIELNKLAANPLALKLDPSLQTLALKFNHSYLAYKQACRAAYPPHSG